MAYGGPAGDPQVTSDLNTIRACQRKLNAGTLEWPLDTEDRDRLAWSPAVGVWRCEDQFFTWDEADYKVKWDSARALLME
eukprot:4831021-Amphidinium_carterae.1